MTVVQYLVQQGVNKNKAANDGMTPLAAAAATANGHIVVANYLRENGAI